MLKGYILEKYSNMAGAYTCHRIVEEAQKRNIDLRIIGAADLTICDGVVMHQGIPLSDCDFVILRYKAGRMKEAISRLAKRVYNDMDAFHTYVNKFKQVELLKSDAFILPRYIMGTGYTPYQMVVERVGLPFVSKGLESSQGEEVYLIENEQQYQKLLKDYPKEKEYLHEEYIKTSYGRDIRFYSVRGDVIACMTREAVSGFKANVALGAKVKAYPIEDGIKKIAKDIYEQTGLDFLGIDLLFGEEKPYFCEINVMPGIAGMEKASGVNVAAQMINTIIGDFENDSRAGY